MNLPTTFRSIVSGTKPRLRIPSERICDLILSDSSVASMSVTKIGSGIKFSCSPRRMTFKGGPVPFGKAAPCPESHDAVLVEKQDRRALAAKRPRDCVESSCEGLVERPRPIKPVRQVVESSKLSGSEAVHDVAKGSGIGDLCSPHHAPYNSHRSGKPLRVKTVVSLFPHATINAGDGVGNDGEHAAIRLWPTVLRPRTQFGR